MLHPSDVHQIFDMLNDASADQLIEIGRVVFEHRNKLAANKVDKIVSEMYGYQIEEIVELAKKNKIEAYKVVRVDYNLDLVHAKCLVDTLLAFDE